MWMAIVFGVIAMGGWLVFNHFANKPRGSKFDPDQIEVPKASEGHAISVVFGTEDIKSPTVVAYGDTKAVAVKKDGVNVNYKYYLGIHLVLCMGHVDKLILFKIEDDLVFDNTAGQHDAQLSRYDTGDRFLDYEKIFGGKYEEGGFSGILDLDKGLPSQVYNDYLNTMANLNTNEAEYVRVPAYRGVTSLIGRQVYVGTSAYLRPWSFRVKRIMQRFDGIPQWYPEKATIVTSAESIIVQPEESFQYKIIVDPLMPNPPTSPRNETYGWTPYEFNVRMTEWGERDSYVDFYMLDFFNSWTETDMLTGDGAFSNSFSYDGPYEVGTQWNLKRALWIKKTFSSTGKYNFRVTGTMGVNGKCWIILNSKKLILKAYTYEDFDVIINSDDIPAGENYIQVLALDDYEDVIPPEPEDQCYFSVKIEKNASESMNPAHIIREVMTDPDWGMSIPDSGLTDDSFKYAADLFFNENFGLCLLWDRSSSGFEFIKNVREYVNAELYEDRKTGKYVLKPVRGDYDSNSLFEFNKSNARFGNYKKQTPSNLINEIVINYRDVDLGNDASITISDGSLIEKQNGVVSKKINYPGIVSARVANEVGHRDLNVLSSPLDQFEITTSDEIADSFNLGDVVKVTNPDYLMTSFVVRIIGIVISNGIKGGTRLKVIEDVFTHPTLDHYIESDVGWTNPATNVKPIFAYSAFEIPYFKAIQTKGLTALDLLLNQNPQIGFVNFEAGRPTTNSINADIYTSTGAGYTLKENIDFCPYAKLTNEINETETTLTIHGEVETSEVNDRTLLQIDDEILNLISKSTGEIVVERGVLDTVVSKHPVDSYIIFWGDYVTANNNEFSEGDEVDIKALTISGKGSLNLEDVDPVRVTLNSRLNRPYPPGNLKFNDEYFPESLDFSAAIEMAWEDRNRLLYDVVAFPDTGIQSEAGVTYLVNIFNASDLNTPLYTASDIASSPHTVPADSITGIDNAIVQLSSMRGGLESFQKYSHQIELEVSDIFTGKIWQDIAPDGDSDIFPRGLNIINDDLYFHNIRKIHIYNEITEALNLKFNWGAITYGNVSIGNEIFFTSSNYVRSYNVVSDTYSTIGSNQTGNVITELNGVIYTGSTTSGDLRYYNETTNQHISLNILTGVFIYNMTVINGRIYIGCNNGNAYTYNQSEGLMNITPPIGNGNFSAFGIHNNELYTSRTGTSLMKLSEGVWYDISSEISGFTFCNFIKSIDGNLLIGDVSDYTGSPGKQSQTFLRRKDLNGIWHNFGPNYVDNSYESGEGGTSYSGVSDVVLFNGTLYCMYVPVSSSGFPFARLI